MYELEQYPFNSINIQDYSGHKDEVNCMAFSPDFAFMITGSDDHRVRVFNVGTETLVCSLKGHTGAVTCCAVSRDSRRFATGSHDHGVRIWETATANCLHDLSGHSKVVAVMTFSDNGRFLCTGSWDRSAILWDVENGTNLATIKHHTDAVQSVAFSACGRMMATGSWDTTICLYSMRKDPTFSEPNILIGHTGNVKCLMFSNDGILASGSWDKTIRLWNGYNGRMIHTIMDHGWVMSLAFSPDGCYIVSGGDDGTLRLWDVVTRDCLKVFEGHTDQHKCCGFSPSGAIISAGASYIT